MVGCDGTVVGNPGCDWMAEVVTCTSCSVCTGGDEKVARGSGVSWGGVEGSNVCVDERASAEAEMGRSEESNRGSAPPNPHSTLIRRFQAFHPIYPSYTSKTPAKKTPTLLFIKIIMRIITRFLSASMRRIFGISVEGS